MCSTDRDNSFGVHSNCAFCKSKPGNKLLIEYLVSVYWVSSVLVKLGPLTFGRPSRRVVEN